MLKSMPDPGWEYELKMVQGLLERDARNCESLILRSKWAHPCMTDEQLCSVLALICLLVCMLTWFASSSYRSRLGLSSVHSCFPPIKHSTAEHQA